MAPSFTIEPEPSAWIELANADLSGRWRKPSMRDWRELTRRELGLPANGKLIVTGHQPLFWHPGILAKFLMVDALGAALGSHRAHGVHLVVNHDENSFGSIDCPVLDESGLLQTETVQLLEHPAGTIPAETPASMPREIPSNLQFSATYVRNGLVWIVERLRPHADAPNAAEQIARSVSDLMSRWVAPMPLVFSSRLLATSFGRALVDAMANDPRRCAESFNEAVASFPDAGLNPLQIARGRVELPLWRVVDGARLRVFSDELSANGASGNRLYPRVLLMTAIMRTAVCDLFVHGRGGFAYDGAMEKWIESWLGLRPAPMTMATADLYLPLREKEEETPDLDQTIREYRQLWHDPSSDERDRLSREKKGWLARIEAAPRGSAERRALFFAMHDWLEKERANRQERLTRVRGRIEEARRAKAEEKILTRRDWPFPLYPDSMLDNLAAKCKEQFMGSI